MQASGIDLLQETYEISSLIVTFKMSDLIFKLARFGTEREIERVCCDYEENEIYVVEGNSNKCTFIVCASLLHTLPYFTMYVIN